MSLISADVGQRVLLRKNRNNIAIADRKVAGCYIADNFNRFLILQGDNRLIESTDFPGSLFVCNLLNFCLFCLVCRSCRFDTGRFCQAQNHYCIGRHCFSCFFFCCFFIYCFFFDSRGKINRIQQNACILHAVVMAVIFVCSCFVFAQPGQAGVLHIEVFDVAFDVCRNLDNIIAVQFAFSGNAIGCVNNRFPVYRTKDLIQLLVSKHIAGGDCGKACRESVRNRLLNDLDNFFSRLLGGFFSGFLCRFFCCRLLNNRSGLLGRFFCRFLFRLLCRFFCCRLLNDGNRLFNNRSGLFDDGSGVLNHGSGLFDNRSRLFDNGSGLFDDGSRLFDNGSGLLNNVSGLFDNGSRLLNDRGFCCCRHFFHDRHFTFFPFGEHADRDAGKYHGQGQKKAQPFAIFHYFFSFFVHGVCRTGRRLMGIIMHMQEEHALKSGL